MPPSGASQRCTGWGINKQCSYRRAEGGRGGALSGCGDGKQRQALLKDAHGLRKEINRKTEPSATRCRHRRVKEENEAKQQQQQRHQRSSESANTPDTHGHCRHTTSCSCSSAALIVTCCSLIGHQVYRGGRWSYADWALAGGLGGVGGVSSGRSQFASGKRS